MQTSSAVGSKTSFLVIGFEPGQSKVDKAKKKKTTIIDEEGLLRLITHLSPEGEPKLPVALKSLKASKPSEGVKGKSIQMAPAETIERAPKVQTHLRKAATYTSKQ